MSVEESPGILVRPATREDGPAILECLRIAFEPYRHHYTPDAFADTTLTPETLAARMAAMTILVAAEASGEIVGTIALSVINDTEGHLRGMAVLPRGQGQGIADSLLAAAEAELRSRGCKRITLDTTAPLERAMRFYERHGYRRSGAVADFFGMPLYEYQKLL